MDKLPDKIKKDMAMDRIGRKLCKFLEEYYEKEVIEFRVAMQSPDHFIIHPMNVDGKTLDVKWDFKNATYGNEVFGYINKGNEFDDPHPEQGEQGEVYKWVKASSGDLPKFNDVIPREVFAIRYKNVGGGHNYGWLTANQIADYNKSPTYQSLEWLCKLSSPPPEGQDDPVAFAKWIGCKFFYDDESELWETIPEGKTYDFNGQKQFRFTSDELYKLFKMQKDFIGDPDECTGAFEGQ